MEDNVICKDCGAEYELDGDAANPSCPECGSNQFTTRQDNKPNTMGKTFTKFINTPMMRKGRPVKQTWSGLEGFQATHGLSYDAEGNELSAEVSMSGHDIEVFERMLKSGTKRYQVGMIVYSISSNKNESLVNSFEDAKQGDIYKISTSGGERFAIRGDSLSGFGDELYPSFEAATNAITRRAELDKRNAEFNAKQDIRKKSEQDVETLKQAEYENDKGFTNGLSPMKRGLALKVLNGLIRYDGRVMSKKAYIEELVDKGGVPTIQVEPKIKQPSRSRYNRMSNKEQKDYDKKIGDAGTKSVYQVLTPDGIFHYVSKTEFDYAEYLTGGNKNESVKDDVMIKTKASDYKDLKTVEEIHAALVAKAPEDISDADKESLKDVARKYYQKKNESLVDEIIACLGGEQRFCEAWITDAEYKYNRIQSDYPEMPQEEIFELLEALDARYTSLIEEQESQEEQQEEIVESVGTLDNLDVVIDEYGKDEVMDLFCLFKGCERADYNDYYGFVYWDKDGNEYDVSKKDINDFLETFEEFQSEEDRFGRYRTGRRFDPDADYTSKDFDF